MEPSSLLLLSLSKDTKVPFNYTISIYTIRNGGKIANRNSLSIKTSIENLFCYHLLMLNMAVISNSVL